MNKETILQGCTVEGNVVKLPTQYGQLDKKLYTDVKNAIEKIGGKWKGGKVFGFVFEKDPSQLLEQIANGEKINLQKEFQFFATPDDVADKLVSLAGIKEADLILEPSAGRGAIVNAINRVIKDKEVHCFELMDTNIDVLKKIDTVILLGNDFIDFSFKSKMIFDKIIANPPFSKNQDIDHVTKMYDVLASKGRLVSVVSKHWQLSQNKKETEFRSWLHNIGAEIIEIKAGAFKQSGTMVGTCILVINKK